jgi:D-alanyl-D-alanine carboxypeptidase
MPTGGQGTLEDRLHGIPVRAKTGTLSNISALSGWVWLRQEKAWATFSILSGGMPKYTAAAIEDRIVRVVHRAAP